MQAYRNTKPPANARGSFWYVNAACQGIGYILLLVAAIIGQQFQLHGLPSYLRKPGGQPLQFH